MALANPRIAAALRLDTTLYICLVYERAVKVFHQQAIYPNPGRHLWYDCTTGAGKHAVMVFMSFPPPCGIVLPAATGYFIAIAL